MWGEKVPWIRNSSQFEQLMNKKKVHSLLLREERGIVCLFVCSFMFVFSDMLFVQGWISWWEGREGVWGASAEKGGERKCGTSEKVPWANECLVSRADTRELPWSKLGSDLEAWCWRHILIPALTSWFNLSFLLDFALCFFPWLPFYSCNQEGTSPLLRA